MLLDFLQNCKFRIFCFSFILARTSSVTHVDTQPPLLEKWRSIQGQWKRLSNDLASDHFEQDTEQRLEKESVAFFEQWGHMTLDKGERRIPARNSDHGSVPMTQWLEVQSEWAKLVQTVDKNNSDPEETLHLEKQLRRRMQRCWLECASVTHPLDERGSITRVRSSKHIADSSLL
jgi:hypothetical protein